MRPRHRVTVTVRVTAFTGFSQRLQWLSGSESLSRPLSGDRRECASAADTLSSPSTVTQRPLCGISTPCPNSRSLSKGHCVAQH
jgi:hypothetical protein